MRLIGRRDSPTSKFQGPYGISSVFVFFSDHGPLVSNNRTPIPHCLKYDSWGCVPTILCAEGIAGESLRRGIREFGVLQRNGKHGNVRWPEIAVKGSGFCVARGRAPLLTN